jgi:hypothetical protein
MVKKIFVFFGKVPLLVLLGIFHVLLYLLIPGNNGWIETYYSDGLFQVLGVFLTVLFGWTSFPIGWLLLFLVCISIIFQVGKTLRNRNRIEKLKYLFLYSCNVLALVFVIFIWTWGWNYKGINQAFDETTPLPNYTKSEIDSFLKEEVEEWIKFEAEPMDVKYLEEMSYENDVNELLNKVLPKEKTKTKFSFIKKIKEGLYFLFGGAGLYVFWTGEPSIDMGLHYLARPIVVAHEKAHSCGISGEGECDFYAFQALYNSENISLKRAYHVSMIRELLRIKRINYAVDYEEAVMNFPSSLQSLILDIKTKHKSYPLLSTWFREYLYDRFLKSQGINQGIENYSSGFLWHLYKIKNAKPI